MQQKKAEAAYQKLSTIVYNLDKKRAYIYDKMPEVIVIELPLAVAPICSLLIYLFRRFLACRVAEETKVRGSQGRDNSTGEKSHCCSPSGTRTHYLT
jgi:hypothetical protein